jgi:hypothetical protein
MKLPPLKKNEDPGGHVIATCWHRIPNSKKYWKTFICVKCKTCVLPSSSSPIFKSGRDERCPPYFVIYDCDEEKTRQILET